MYIITIRCRFGHLISSRKSDVSLLPKHSTSSDNEQDELRNCIHARLAIIAFRNPALFSCMLPIYALFRRALSVEKLYCRYNSFRCNYLGNFSTPWIRADHTFILAESNSPLNAFQDLHRCYNLSVAPVCPLLVTSSVVFLGVAVFLPELSRRRLSLSLRLSVAKARTARCLPSSCSVLSYSEV